MKTLVLLICAAVLLTKAEEFDEVQGDGPFTSPLEPEDSRFVGYAVDHVQTKHQVIRVVPTTQQQLKAIKDLEELGNFDISFWTEPTTVGSPVDFMISEVDLSAVSNTLSLAGLTYTVLNKDVDRSIQEENFPHGGTMYSSFSGFDYGRYHQLHEIHRELNDLASRYPKLASVFTLGYSHERRAMQAIKISSGGNGRRKTFFFNCGIHAREWVTPATCIYMINQMLTKYGRDRAVTAMIDKMDWVVLPVFNVDGYAHTWTSRDRRVRLWRKTRKATWNSMCPGVDPNRNWDVNWGGVGTSPNPCSDTYPGPHAFSETEVKQVADYLSGIKHKLVGYTDIHAYSQLWMYPYGHTRSPPRDYYEMERVAKAAVGALTNIHGTYYRYGSSSVVIYPTTGGSNDWVYSKLGVKYSYALELRDRGRYGFILPASQIKPTAEETFAGFKAMAAAMRI